MFEELSSLENRKRMETCESYTYHWTGNYLRIIDN